MKYLTAEHMVAILKQRALELEADLFSQQTERDLATQLNLPEVVSAAEAKIKTFEGVLAALEEKIVSHSAPVEEPPPPPPPPVEPTP